MAVTGIIAFIQPFSIEIIGLHALTGFLFIGVVVGHIFNNSVALKKYIKKSCSTWSNRGLLFLQRSCFIINLLRLRKILGLSGNLGPALDLFEMDEKGIDLSILTGSGL